MDEKKDYKTARAAASIVILVIAVLLWRLFDMGFAAFDAGFPKKEKLVLPGQIF